MKLLENQAAMILGISEDGEISVDVAGSDLDSLAGALCQAITVKLMKDDIFQAERMQLFDNIENSIFFTILLLRGHQW